MNRHGGRRILPTLPIHVDATLGNNANNGRTSGKPIQTVAGVNALRVRRNSRVLFKRGETWSGTQLTFPGSGAPGQPVLLGAYGVGARPILTVANNESIYVDNVHDIAIKGLNLISSGTGDAALHVYGCHGFEFDDNDIQGGDVAAIWIDVVAGRPAYDGRITNNLCHDAADNGGIHSTIQPPGSSFVGLQNTLVEGNTVYNNGVADGDHGIYLQDSTGCIVRKNICYHNFDAGIKV